ncbi:undecaprenyl-diphosphate phosphatase [Polymorphobacter fuscus]|uniref:Undecaprenyl-diphosphatase n=1 Tax=Sandarakinorhabdus fusca TaxID=1439888 RepID=A0A7C9GVR6_9SPHN|nr:undecaprenyl-diphosphate phosphatase [Polymorphobacter fuscus]KAB7646494.1 undecaprenyl-diphosphate phosphatase [Polymorphobacter fuscus]MQT17738.1 undecaprenyl-diphosphate phosphatase [Polymorphobacter fuscus]NJC09714.1 undecaprenyl-diphosphatase [Polymorphobacter fuscus]
MEQSLLTVILLGIIEGLTEFLPVSSTGHLILASELLGFKGEAELAFKIAIQLGAILAVLVAYRQRFGAVIGGLARRDPQAIAFTRNIALGFLPAMVVGVFAYETIKVMLESPMTVAIALIVGGIAILVIERLVLGIRYLSIETIPGLTALLIGIGQCVAMIPGVSRSGATIMGGLLAGVERKTAAEYSFFLAVPTMTAATAYALYKNRDALAIGDLTAIAIGFVVSFVVALAVVKAFVAIVGRFGFAPFAWYRIVVGSVALLLLLNR